jgi:hypothetical protein
MKDLAVLKALLGLLDNRAPRDLADQLAATAHKAQLDRLAQWGLLVQRAARVRQARPDTLARPVHQDPPGT